MNEQLEYLFTLSGKCRSIFVAGGYVVSPALATDIDIWFGNDRRDLAKNLLAKLAFRQPKPEGSLLPYEGSDSFCMGEGFDPLIGKTVQVLVTKKDNAEDLMQGFDISTHKWAITSRGEEVKGQFATTASEAPRILKWAPNTLQRYIKICHRYGHLVNPQELEPYNEVMELMEAPSQVKQKGKGMKYQSLQEAFAENEKKLAKQAAEMFYKGDALYDYLKGNNKGGMHGQYYTTVPASMKPEPEQKYWYVNWNGLKEVGSPTTSEKMVKDEEDLPF